METVLLYLEQMHLLESTAKVFSLPVQDERQAIILDQTVFYPQGGGQPYDTGRIVSKKGEFIVTEVRNIDGLVWHYGSGPVPEIGESVQLLVDAERRLRHSKLHTAGHVVDSALANLGLKWTDSRGHHFPDGPYVAYENLSESSEDLKSRIESEANRLIAEGYDVQSLFVTPEELPKHCFPGNFNYPAGKKLRIIKVYGELGCPCGGTHVKNIQEIGSIKIPKLKKEKGMTRVRYDC